MAASCRFWNRRGWQSTKLHEFIAAALVAPGADIAPQVAEGYQALLAAALTSSQLLPEVEGMELEERVTREQALARQPSPWSTATTSGAIVLATLLLVLTGLARRGALA